MPLIDDLTTDFIRTHCSPCTDVRKLALQSALYPGVDLKEALVQISGWQIASRKLPSWARTEGIVYPPHLSMEQCSSEQTARYKTEVIASFDLPTGRKSVLVDLTGGLGVDFSFLAPGFARAVYVEPQECLCDCARNNFPLLNLRNVVIEQACAEEYLSAMEPVSWIYLDPARRDETGRKRVRISDCQPDVAALQIQLLAKATHVLVKFSPMLDLTQLFRELPEVVREVHVVAVSGECKELLVVLGRESGNGPRIKLHALNFLSGGGVQRFSFSPDEEFAAVCDYADKPQTYLYEPNAAVLKAGGYRLLAQAYGLRKMHPDAHLYTSHERCASFPGRCFRVEGFAGFNKKELKQLLGDLKHAHLTVRGFPATVAELRKRLALKEGGDAYFFATTVAGGRKLLIRCSKIK